MSAFDRVLDSAREHLRSVVLPESGDERVLRAASIASQSGIARPVLLGQSGTIRAQANALDIDLADVSIIEPDLHSRRDHYVNVLVERRKHRGMNAAKASAALNDSLTYACMMVSENDVDACVAGAITPTAEVVHCAVRHVGKHKDEALVSSCFIMLLKPEHPIQDAMVIGDCALVIEPDAEQLAAIAVATGESARQFLNLEPQVAMLSYSTAGSARHSSVSKVIRATALTREQRPQWRIVGEVQLDAAVLPGVLASKAPDQATDEPCNVLIFPNLNAGNIGYKLIERFGGAQAIGPILQGLARPVNDVSRGCSTEDIVRIIAVSAAQVKD